jgi:hypothetical protein
MWAATFAEQIDGLTTPHARYSPVLRTALTRVAVALAARERISVVRSRPTMYGIYSALCETSSTVRTSG